MTTASDVQVEAAGHDESLQLDGTYGEGSGQLIRNASSLSVLARRPLRVIGVRAERSTPDCV